VCTAQSSEAPCVCTSQSRECVCVLHSLESHSLVIRKKLEQFNIFKYFIIILIVSTNNIFVHLLDIKVF